MSAHLTHTEVAEPLEENEERRPTTGAAPHIIKAPPTSTSPQDTGLPAGAGVAPYRDAAPVYVAAGWPGVLPLLPRKKDAPPKGYTGEDGGYPTPETVEGWRITNPYGNVALRMPDGVVAIDVDQYDAKRGADNLETFRVLHGLDPLPATWSSSAREAPSRVLLYRVPSGCRVRGQVVRHVEALQRHHRYLVVEPSVHPDTGTAYLWRDPEGEVVHRPPSPEELPMLPEEWLAALDERTGLPAAPQAPVPVVAPSPQAAHEAPVEAPSWWTQEASQAEGARLLALEAAVVAGTLPGGGGTSDLGRNQTGNNAAISMRGLEMVGAITEDQAHEALTRAMVENGYVADKGKDAWEATWDSAWTSRNAKRRDPWPPANYRPPADPFDVAKANAPEGGSRVDWSALFTADRVEHDWLVEPLIPRGRSVALYAPAKAGKSLLILAAVAPASLGRATLRHPEGKPVRTLYLDYEMTEDDLADRMDALGIGPEDAEALEAFAYLLQPAIPPLDTAAGGRAVLEMAREHRADLVVIDTMGRAVEGAENDADTFRAYYRHTGMALKREGIANLRADHAGKEAERGQRGSSAKNDDVDVVWRLLPGKGNAYRLTATHRRLGWVPETVDLTLQTDPLRFTPAGVVWPLGTREAAAMLDRLGISLDLGRGKVREAVKAAGETPPRNEVLAAAMRYRRAQADADPFRDQAGPVPEAPKPVPGQFTAGLEIGRGQAAGQPPETPPEQAGQVPGQVGTGFGAIGDKSPPLRGGQSQADLPKPLSGGAVLAGGDDPAAEPCNVCGRPALNRLADGRPGHLACQR